MVPLHKLGQDDQNEMQCDIFGHVTPLVLALAPHDTESVVNGTITFLRSRLK